MLDKEVIELLSKPLDPKIIKHRAGGGGMSLAYLAGHEAIDQANKIFKPGNWGYDIIAVELVNISGDGGEIVGGYYAARVKLTVAGCVPITEEGVCPIQEGRNPRAKIDAHDMARKGAVTDAMKRAFRCYGDQFGNSLYDTDLIDGQPGTERSTNTNSNQAKPSQAAQRPTQAQVQQSRPVAPPQAQAPQQAVKPVTPPAPSVVHMGDGEKATDQQKEAILKMAGRKGVDDIQLNDRLTQLYGVAISGLTKSDASHFIKVFQGQA